MTAVNQSKIKIIDREKEVISEIEKEKVYSKANHRDDVLIDRSYKHFYKILK